MDSSRIKAAISIFLALNAQTSLVMDPDRDVGIQLGELLVDHLYMTDELQRLTRSIDTRASQIKTILVNVGMGQLHGPVTKALLGYLDGAHMVDVIQGLLPLCQRINPTTANAIRVELEVTGRRIEVEDAATLAKMEAEGDIVGKVRKVATDADLHRKFWALATLFQVVEQYSSDVFDPELEAGDIPRHLVTDDVDDCRRQWCQTVVLDGQDADRQKVEEWLRQLPSERDSPMDLGREDRGGCPDEDKANDISRGPEAEASVG